MNSIAVKLRHLAAMEDSNMIASGAAEIERLEAENKRLREALSEVLRFPVHSEPVGSAYAMQDIARAALAKEGQ